MSIRTHKVIPSGNITSTNIGAALAEIDSKKEPANANIVKKNVANTFTATQVLDNGTAAISATGTYTFDGADQIREFALTGVDTITFGAPTSITRFAEYTFILKAGDTSARTTAWNAAYKFPGGVPANTISTLSTTVGGYDVVTFIGGISNTLIFKSIAKDCR